MVSRLLKSWATPPARRPTLSSFWACCSCSRNRFLSVMSRLLTTIPPTPGVSRRFRSPDSTSAYVPSARRTRTSTRLVALGVASTSAIACFARR